MIHELKKIGDTFNTEYSMYGVDILIVVPIPGYKDDVEATRQFRAKDSKAHIIAMTANTMQDDREESLAAGVDDYLSKPIQVKELLAALERCR